MINKKEWRQFRDTCFWVSKNGEIAKIEIESKTTSKGIELNAKMTKKAQSLASGSRYLRVDINGASLYVHRIVAEAWIANPLNLETVNHKNEIKTDNRVENLEWMSQADNSRYSLNKEVSMFALATGKILHTFDSLKQAGEYIAQENKHVNAKNAATYIGQCAHSKHKSAYGYNWAFTVSVFEPTQTIDTDEEGF